MGIGVLGFYIYIYPGTCVRPEIEIGKMSMLGNGSKQKEKSEARTGS